MSFFAKSGFEDTRKRVIEISGCFGLKIGSKQCINLK